MSHTYPITMQQDAAPAGPIDAIVRGAVLSLADCLRAPRVRTATVETDAQGLPILAAPFPAALLHAWGAEGMSSESVTSTAMP